MVEQRKPSIVTAVLGSLCVINGKMSVFSPAADSKVQEGRDDCLEGSLTASITQFLLLWLLNKRMALHFRWCCCSLRWKSERQAGKGNPASFRETKPLRLTVSSDTQT